MFLNLLLQFLDELLVLQGLLEVMMGQLLKSGGDVVVVEVEVGAVLCQLSGY